VNQAHNAKYPDRSRRIRKGGRSNHSSARLSNSRAPKGTTTNLPPVASCTSKAEILPGIKIEQSIAHRDSASRTTTLKEAATLQTVAKDMKSLASSSMQRSPSVMPSSNGQWGILPGACQPKQIGLTPHCPTTQPHISYSAFAMLNCRLTLLQWPEGSLIGKTIERLFDEVAYLARSREIKTIFFKLAASQKDAVCVVQRNDVGSFDNMKKKFSSLINEDLKLGNIDFGIEMDPGHEALQ